MIPILKAVLLGSFIGLAIIIGRNRVQNPEMRIQFFEDLEYNKKRIKTIGRRVLEGIDKLSQRIKHLTELGVTVLLPQLKKGIILFMADVWAFGRKVKDKLATGVRELKEDMKAFELPKKKEDFLEKLDEGSKREEGVRTEEKHVRGFRVSELAQGGKAEEVQIDRRILEKKEQGLVYAIAKNPTNPTFYKKLGKVYLQMQNIPDAKNCFEYALRLGSQDPEVKKFLQEIERAMAG